MIIKSSNLTEIKTEILIYFTQKKFSRILDIGGTMYPWAHEFTTHYLDILDIKLYMQKYPHFLTDKVLQSKMFLGDINDNFGWEEVFKDVEENGKFDFVICSNTLEDIRNPSYVLRVLPMIANEGYIAVPCKHSELCRPIECGEEEEQRQWKINGNFRGYFHHRWICSLVNDIFTLYPKLNFIEYLTFLDWATKENKDKYWHELSFWWKGDIKFKIINDDFLGPNGCVACGFYEGIKEGL